ncbi:MAG: hypothetical protein HY830_00390 [Actinobacteria bacterium]|nr:hypothetical protein [Actinomycetota bacterium]
MREALTARSTAGRTWLRRRTLVGLAVVACAVPAGLAAATAASPAQAATTTPVLVDVRAAHHPGYDRVVFEYTGKGPTAYTVKYVTTLVADGSGQKVPVAGRAILSVVMRDVDAHTVAGKVPTPLRQAFALKNVTSTVRSGDFEAVVSYGVGLQKKTAFHTHRLSSPARVVVDVTTPFTTVNRRVWFADSDKVAANVANPVTSVWRQVLPTTPATGVMDRIYAGPTKAEKAAGLFLQTSRTTGWTNLRISSDGIARVQLTGPCGDGSAVVTVASEIFPSLRQFSTVDHVKVYGPDGTTEYPTGHRDSIPECLEP